MSQGLARRRALQSLARRLGLGSKCVENGLLDMALTHDSFAAERPGKSSHAASNERLEFLGDAVLGAAVAHALYQSHPDTSEGDLSRMRAALISRAALARSAERLEIADMLLLGRGEKAAGGARRPKVLAATFEAIVAAVFVSEGFEAARRFIERQHLARATLDETTDPKTALQEYAQAKFKKTPHYATTAQSGPPHARIFSVSVSVGGKVLGAGDGATKKQAETAAAREALATMGQRPQADMR